MAEHLGRAMLLYGQSRFDLAESELRQELGENPSNGLAHSMLALCLLEREAYDEATREAKEAIALAPDQPQAHYTLGRVWHERNHFDEAAACALEAIRLAPDEAEYFALLGGVRLSQSRWQEALEAAERGLALDAEDVACTNLRAIALVKLGRRAEAGATIDEALRRNPENAVTHANQGWTLLEKGDAKKALEHFREALRLDPTSEWAREGIVEALKARNIIYAVMLKYFLFMAKLSGGAQWALIVGGFIGYRVVASIAAKSPALKPYLMPLIIAYVVFAVMTWIAVPLFNLMLRVSRFGRLALSREQTVASNWFGACLVLALAGGAVWLLARDPNARALGGYGAIVFGFLLLPVAGTFMCPSGWPRWTMAGYTALLLLIATVGLMMNPGVAVVVFVLGIFASQWIANALARVTVRR